MATNTLLGGAMGWLDLWKTVDPSGNMAQIFNETTETNNLLQHSMWMPANMGQTHQGTRVASLPSSSKKRMGVGTAPASGSHVNFTEETTVNEIWGEIEDEVLKKHPNPEAYINQQIALAIQGSSQDMVQEMLYGNRATNPEQVNGIMTRLGSIQTDRKQGRVLSATGASNANSSILGIKWGEDGVYFLYPKDHPTAGVEYELFPAENKRDTNGKIMRVRTFRVQWAFGLAIGNRRNFFRLANIDASITPANWITLVENNLITLINDTPNDGQGFRLYGNNFTKTNLDIRVKDKSNVWFSPTDPISQKPGQFTMFNQTPFYKVERMIATEANVT
jgi:hypothetical protein